MEELNKVYWHDGILEDVRLSMAGGISEIFLTVGVYENHEAPLRKTLAVRFFDVESCLVAGDINDLLDNRSAGNVSNGYAKLLNESKEDGGLVYRMYLSDGYIQIIAKGVEISPG